MVKLSFTACLAACLLATGGIGAESEYDRTLRLLWETGVHMRLIKKAIDARHEAFLAGDRCAYFYWYEVGQQACRIMADEVIAQYTNQSDRRSLHEFTDKIKDEDGSLLEITAGTLINDRVQQDAMAMIGLPHVPIRTRSDYEPLLFASLKIMAERIDWAAKQFRAREFGCALYFVEYARQAVKFSEELLAAPELSGSQAAARFRVASAEPKAAVLRLRSRIAEAVAVETRRLLSEERAQHPQQ